MELPKWYHPAESPVKRRKRETRGARKGGPPAIEEIEEEAAEAITALEEYSPALERIDEAISNKFEPIDNAITNASNKAGGMIVAGLSAAAAALKGDNSPTPKSSNVNNEEKKPTDPAPQADGAGAKKGGGRNEQKVNPDRVQSAKDKVADLTKQRDALRSKANKTPEDKAELEKTDKALNRQKDRLAKSETHSRKAKGQQQ